MSTKRIGVLPLALITVIHFIVSCSLLEDISKINSQDASTISRDAERCTYLEGYQVGTNAFLFDNGIALYQIEDFSIEEVTQTKGSSYIENNQEAWVYAELNHETAFFVNTIVVYFDIEKRLSCIATSDEEYIFTNYRNTICDIVSVNYSGQYTVYPNVDLKQKEGVSTKTKSDIPLDVLNTISGVQSSVTVALAYVKNAPALLKMSAGLGYLGTLIGGGVGSALGIEGSLLELYHNASNNLDVSGTIRGLGIQLATELWIRNREYMKDNFGLVNISIDECIPSLNGSAHLFYTISGFIESPKYPFSKSIHWSRANDGWGGLLSSTSYGDIYYSNGAENGSYDEIIDFGLSGTYTVSIFLKPNIKGWTPILFSESCTVSIENEERDALIKLYNATSGDNWINNTNWCSNLPLDEWYGVTTNAEGFVTSIKLDNNNLRGSALDINLGIFSKLQSFSINNNEIEEIRLEGNNVIKDITLDNCIRDRITIDGIENIYIRKCNGLSSISGYASYLEVADCDFGEHRTPFSINADDAVIKNCTMHSCGLYSNTLRFENSKTYDTWYCGTVKKLELVNCYCSTICGGDFNDSTVIVMQNATLWRSNWDEKSLVTLTLTTTGKGWYSIWQ